MNIQRTHFNRRFSLAAIAATSVIALAACGGGDDASGTTASAATSAPADDEMADDTKSDDEMADDTKSDDEMADGPHSDTAKVLATGTPVGGDFDPASIDGKDAVLWFWAPWCPKCREEAPAVEEVQQQFGDQVQFVGVPGLGSTEEMQEFISTTGVGAFPHVADESGDVWTQLGVPSMPAFVFVNDDGTVENVNGALGADALTEKVEELVAS